MEPKFHHELEWYDYIYIPEREQVCICPKGSADVCTLYFTSREELERRLLKHKLNPFLQPIYREALNHFPKGDQHEHESEVRQAHYE